MPFHPKPEDGLQEGDSSKRVQTLVVLVLSLSSSSSSSCSVRRWRVLWAQKWTCSRWAWNMTLQQLHLTHTVNQHDHLMVCCVLMCLLSSRQQGLFLIFLDARAPRFHLQRRGGGLLCGRLDEMSKQLRLLQQVLKSVGPVRLLHRRKQLNSYSHLFKSRVVFHDGFQTNNCTQ